MLSLIYMAALPRINITKITPELKDMFAAALEYTALGRNLQGIRREDIEYFKRKNFQYTMMATGGVLSLSVAVTGRKSACSLPCVHRNRRLAKALVLTRTHSAQKQKHIPFLAVEKIFLGESKRNA